MLHHIFYSKYEVNWVRLDNLSYVPFFKEVADDVANELTLSMLKDASLDFNNEYGLTPSTVEYPNGCSSDSTSTIKFLYTELFLAPNHIIKDSDTNKYYIFGLFVLSNLSDGDRTEFKNWLRLCVNGRIESLYSSVRKSKSTKTGIKIVSIERADEMFNHGTHTCLRFSMHKNRKRIMIHPTHSNTMLLRTGTNMDYSVLRLSNMINYL